MQARDRQLFPNAFGLEKMRVRLKRNAEEKLKAVYLPFTMQTSYCTVVFEDPDQGSFCYELVGDTTLPSVFAEQRMVVDVSGPQTRWLPVPFANHQLEAAKRLFLDRHPLAKDKDQVALIKPRLSGMQTGLVAFAGVGALYRSASFALRKSLDLNDLSYGCVWTIQT